MILNPRDSATAIKVLNTSLQKTQDEIDLAKESAIITNRTVKSLDATVNGTIELDPYGQPIPLRDKSGETIYDDYGEPIFQRKGNGIVMTKAKVDDLEAKMVTTDTLVVTVRAEIQNADIDALQVNSINGNPIAEGTILAKALSGAMVETISGNKVIYQAEEPTGDFRNGDTWYKTLVEEGESYASAMYVWNDGWVETPLDAELIRVGSITAREIASDYVYAGTVQANQVLFGGESEEENRTADIVVKDLEQSTSDSLDEAKANINAEIERLNTKYNEVDNKADIGSYDEQIAELLAKSIIAQGYGELRDGTIRLHTQDGASSVYLDGNGVQLRTDNVTVAYIVSDQTVGSALRVDKSIQNTIRLRTSDNVGTLAIVSNKVGNHGHVTLKEVL